MQDFDGSDLGELLSSAAQGHPTISTVLPFLHAIGATRTCINLNRPSRKQFFWQGKSDGVWLSHQLTRDRGRSRRLHGDPCEVLARHAVPLPNDLSSLRGVRREQAKEILGIPPEAAVTDTALRDRLIALPPAPNAAHFILRRRLAPRRGSVLALGDRANLDRNRFDCPTQRALVGCSTALYEAPFLGAFIPHENASSEWVDAIPAAPPFKYCRRTASGVADQPSKRIPGVALLLPELHGNINVGHAVKDLVFLAHVLAEQRAARGTNHSFAVTTILVDDKATATGNLSSGQQGFVYRKASIEALVAGVTPPIHVVYLQQGALHRKEDFGQEPEWRGASSVCFDVMLQKGFAYAGDWRGAQLFRGGVYETCGIDPAGEADSVLIVVHGLASSGHTTRRWHDQTSLVDSVRWRPFRTRWCGAADAHKPGGPKGQFAPGTCKPLRVLVRAMEGLSFCEQAALYARSKVVITHHGASLANGFFLRERSLMVELNRQWRANVAGEGGTKFANTFDGAGYAGLFLSSGVGYIGARVTYGVWSTNGRNVRNDGHVDQRTGAVRWQLKDRVRYDFTDPTMEIGINASRWAEVLDEIDEIIISQGRAAA